MMNKNINRLKCSLQDITHNNYNLAKEHTKIIDINSYVWIYKIEK